MSHQFRFELHFRLYPNQMNPYNQFLSPFLVSFYFIFSKAMTQQDLFAVWAEEAKEALNAKKSGIILDLWKVVAERKVTITLN